MDYKEKYLKYKQKYLKLKLKIQSGGGNAKIGDIICNKYSESDILGKIVEEFYFSFTLDTGLEIDKNREGISWIKCKYTYEELKEIFKNNIINKLNEHRNRKYLIYEYESKKFNNIDGDSVLPNYDIIIIDENSSEEIYTGNKIIFKITEPINDIFNIKNIKIIQNSIKIFDENMVIQSDGGQYLGVYVSYKYLPNNSNIDDIFKIIYYYIYNTKIYICDWTDVGGRFGNNIMYFIWWCLAFIDKNNIRENIIIGMKYGHIKSKALKIIYSNICVPEIFYPQINITNLGTEKGYDYKYSLNFEKNCNKQQNTKFMEYNILCKKEFIGNLLFNLIEKEPLEIINSHNNSFTNNTCLHYRGSDFCHTDEFNVLHFRYYLESLEIIFQNMTESNTRNITIDIYNHPNDYEIIELMMVYLKYNLNKKYPHISILFRKEKEIFESLNITKFNELNILYTMSLCKNIIMGNSSLSLWAPFLSQNSTIYYIYKDTSSYRINFYPLYSKFTEILYPLHCINILNDENKDSIYYLKYLIPCYLYRNKYELYLQAYNYHTYFILLYIIYFNKEKEHYINNSEIKIDNTSIIINHDLTKLYNYLKSFKEDKTYFEKLRERIFLLENYINILNNIHEEKNENIRNELLSNLIDFLSIENNPEK